MRAMSLTPPLRSLADVDELARSVQRSYSIEDLAALAELRADDMTHEKAALAISVTRLLAALQNAPRNVN
jgi:hypothetical protein